MASRTTQEIQVGIAVLLSVAVLIGGLLWLQDYQLDAQNLTLQVHFDSVGGLGAGDPVHVRGIPLGKVQEIRLVDKGVLATLNVESRVVLREDAVFRISSIGLVGERILALDPGQGEPVADPEARIFEGQYELSMPELAGEMASLGERITEFLGRLEKTMDQLEENGGVAGAVQEATRAARGLADFLEANRASLGATTENLARATGRLDDFWAAHGDSVGQALDRLPATTARVDSLLRRLDRVAADTEILLAAVNDQDGTLGRLIHDPETAERISASVTEVQALIADIRRNPERYLHLTLLQF